MSRKNRSLMTGIAVALCAAAIAYVLVRLAEPVPSAEEDAPVLVELRGIPTAMHMTTWMSHIFARSPADPPLTLILRDGDFVFTGNDGEVPLLYWKEDGRVLDLWVDGPLLRVNSRARTLVLTEEGLEWLTRVPDGELADLRFVTIDGLLPEHVPQLRRIAGVNPHVGLGCEMNSGFPTNLTTDVLQALASFKPRAAILILDASREDSAARELLASWASLEVLITSATSPADLRLLTGLPHLRKLVLVNWDPEETGPIPAGLEGLVSLTLWDSGLENLDRLSALSGLKHLALIVESDALTDYSALKALPALRSVRLGWHDEPVDLSPLYTLQELEHLGLPESTTQDQFVTVVENLPQLRSLDLLMCEQIEDLTPLTSLTDLEFLTIGRRTNLHTLARLEDLRYLNVWLEDSDENVDDYAAVAELRTALPECRIVTSVEPCLGSGYVLLLVPAVILAEMLRRRSCHGARATI